MGNLEHNVVVVEDDEEMSLAIKRLLNAAGFRAIAFTSAEALLQTGVPAGALCLVLDVHLPGLSGFELYHRLRKSGADRPVVFITAQAAPAFAAEARDLGAAFLAKPFSREIFLAAISQAIQSRAAEGDA